MSPSRKLQLAAIALHTLLLVGLIAWSTTLLGLVLSALLLVSLPGLVKGDLYTYRWTCMLVTIYCSVLLADGYARPAERLGAFALAAVAALGFVSQVMFVRVRQRERPAQTAASAAASH